MTDTQQEITPDYSLERFQALRELHQTLEQNAPEQGLSLYRENYPDLFNEYSGIVDEWDNRVDQYKAGENDDYGKYADYQKQFGLYRANEEQIPDISAERIAEIQKQADYFANIPELDDQYEFYMGMTDAEREIFERYATETETLDTYEDNVKQMIGTPLFKGLTNIKDLVEDTYKTYISLDEEELKKHDRFRELQNNLFRQHQDKGWEELDKGEGLDPWIAGAGRSFQQAVEQVPEMAASTLLGGLAGKLAGVVGGIVAARKPAVLAGKLFVAAKKAVTVEKYIRVGQTIGSSVYWGSRGAQDIRKQLLKNGMEPDKAKVYSTIAAIPYGLIEQLGLFGSGRAFSRAAVNKVLAKSIPKKIAGIIKEGGAEWSEEILQNLTVWTTEAIAELMGDTKDINLLERYKQSMKEGFDSWKVVLWLTAFGGAQSGAVKSYYDFNNKQQLRQDLMNAVDSGASIEKIKGNISGEILEQYPDVINSALAYERIHNQKWTENDKPIIEKALGQGVLSRRDWKQMGLGGGSNTSARQNLYNRLEMLQTEEQIGEKMARYDELSDSEENFADMSPSKQAQAYREATGEAKAALDEVLDTERMQPVRELYEGLSEVAPEVIDSIEGQKDVKLAAIIGGAIDAKGDHKLYFDMLRRAQVTEAEVEKLAHLRNSVKGAKSLTKEEQIRAAQVLERFSLASPDTAQFLKDNISKPEVKKALALEPATSAIQIYEMSRKGLDYEPEVKLIVEQKPLAIVTQESSREQLDSIVKQYDLTKPKAGENETVTINRINKELHDLYNQQVGEETRIRKEEEAKNTRRGIGIVGQLLGRAERESDPFAHPNAEIEAEILQATNPAYESPISRWERIKKWFKDTFTKSVEVQKKAISPKLAKKFPVLRENFVNMVNGYGISERASADVAVYMNILNVKGNKEKTYDNATLFQRHYLAGQMLKRADLTGRISDRFGAKHDDWVAYKAQIDALVELPEWEDVQKAIEARNEILSRAVADAVVRGVIINEEIKRALNQGDVEPLRNFVENYVHFETRREMIEFEEADKKKGLKQGNVLKSIKTDIDISSIDVFLNIGAGDFLVLKRLYGKQQRYDFYNDKDMKGGLVENDRMGELKSELEYRELTTAVIKKMKDLLHYAEAMEDEGLLEEAKFDLAFNGEEADLPMLEHYLKKLVGTETYKSFENKAIKNLQEKEVLDTVEEAKRQEQRPPLTDAQILAGLDKILKIDEILDRGLKTKGKYKEALAIFDSIFVDNGFDNIRYFPLYEERKEGKYLPREREYVTKNNYPVDNPKITNSVAQGMVLKDSGLIVIDLDVKKGKDGKQAWDDFWAAVGRTPPQTMSARTKSGGWHLWFRVPKGVDYINGDIDFFKGMGVEAKSQHIIIPTDRKEKYQLNTQTAEIIDLPPDILDMVIRPQWVKKGEQLQLATIQEIARDVYKVDGEFSKDNSNVDTTPIPAKYGKDKIETRKAYETFIFNEKHPTDANLKEVMLRYLYEFRGDRIDEGQTKALELANKKIAEIEAAENKKLSASKQYNIMNSFLKHRFKIVNEIEKDLEAAQKDLLEVYTVNENEGKPNTDPKWVNRSPIDFDLLDNMSIMEQIEQLLKRNPTATIEGRDLIRPLRRVLHLLERQRDWTNDAGARHLAGLPAFLKENYPDYRQHVKPFDVASSNIKNKKNIENFSLDMALNNIMILPNEIVDQLEHLDETYSIQAWRYKFIAAWKPFQLFSPHRFFKYFAHNMYGDLQAMARSSIGVAKELLPVNLAKKALGKDTGELDTFTQVQRWMKDPALLYAEGYEQLKEAVENGVMSVSYESTEMRNYEDIGRFIMFASSKGGWSPVRAAKNIWTGYLKKVTAFNMMFENFRRFAQYKHFRARLERHYQTDEKGLFKDISHWGASKKEYIEAIYEQRGLAPAAARMASDTVGHYGDLSSIANYLKTGMFPFISFQEINMKRFGRMLSNDWQELKNSDSRAKAIKKLVPELVAKVGVSVAFKTIAAYSYFAMITYLFNKMFFPEELEKLEKEDPTGFSQRLIVGETDEGAIRTINGADINLEMMEYFGFSGIISALKQGDDKFLSIAKDAGVASLNKVVQAIAPMQKNFVEIMAGVKVYPDVLNMRPQDRLDAIFSMAGFKTEINSILGRDYQNPSPGNYVFNYTNPKQTAYFTMVEKRAEYMKENNIGNDGWFPRSTAYNIRQAAINGDYEAFKEWKAKYIEEIRSSGRDPYKSFKATLSKLHPVRGYLKDEDEKRFFDALPDELAQTYEVANSYAWEVRDRMYNYWRRDVKENGSALDKKEYEDFNMRSIGTKLKRLATSVRVGSKDLTEEEIEWFRHYDLSRQETLQLFVSYLLSGKKPIKQKKTMVRYIQQLDRGLRYLGK